MKFIHKKNHEVTRPGLIWVDVRTKSSEFFTADLSWGSSHVLDRIFISWSPVTALWIDWVLSSDNSAGLGWTVFPVVSVWGTIVGYFKKRVQIIQLIPVGILFFMKWNLVIVCLWLSRWFVMVTAATSEEPCVTTNTAVPLRSLRCL